MNIHESYMGIAVPACQSLQSGAGATTKKGQESLKCRASLSRNPVGNNGSRKIAPNKML